MGNLNRPAQRGGGLPRGQRVRRPGGRRRGSGGLVIDGPQASQEGAMKLFFLEPPSLWNSTPSHAFASFSHVGTWEDDQLCASCGRSFARLTKPLLIQWDEGSAQIGDFSYCGYTVIVSDRVRSLLVEHGMEFNYYSTETVAPEAPPTGRPRVEFPYFGPALTWIVPRFCVPLNTKKSHLEMESLCSSCGFVDWPFSRKNLVIDRQSWHGERAFEIEQFVPSGAIILTEEGLSMLQSAGLSNLGSHECGVIAF